jgi:hypothetical protein
MKPFMELRTARADPINGGVSSRKIANNDPD